MPKFKISGILVCVALASQTMYAPIYAQSQALTPEQLTQQVRQLNERSQNSASALKKIQQDVDRMNRLVDNRAMIELLQTVEELSAEISLLRGEMEQQTHDISELKKRQRELYLDIDRRLRDVESRATAQAPMTEPVQVPGLNDAPQTPQVEVAAPAIDVTTPGVSTAVGTTGLITDTTPAANTDNESTPSSESASEERAAYQQAFDTLKEGRYKKAKTEFKRFLQRYPDSSFSGNAQYWLGEANYVTREFDQGIIEFELVLSRYPSSSKVADAMLKLGYTYYEKKQFNKARIMLTELSKRYPKATAARLAGKRLERMRKEGH